jgi:hypothetical protein
VSVVRAGDVRAAAAATGTVGLVLLLRPEAVARACSGPDAVPRAWIVRALGSRMLLQALVQAAWPDRVVLDAGTATDAAHASSMVALAAISRRYRRPASLSAAFATASAAFGLFCRSGRR